MEKIIQPIPLNLRDAAEEQTLNFVPTTFDEYLGQEELKQKLHVYTHAAKLRNEPLDHMLLLVLPVLAKQRLVLLWLTS